MNNIGWSSKICLRNIFPMVITISFAMDIFVPAIPEMTHYFHVSQQSIQSSLYLFMFAVAIGQLCIGPLSDVYGRRRVSLCSALLFFVGSCISALATNIPILLIGRIILAFGACGTYIICFIIIRDNFSSESCGRLFSLLSGINAMTASSAPIIGGILMDVTGNWKSEFYFLSALGLIIFFWVNKYIPDYQFKLSEKKEPLASTWIFLLKQPAYRNAALVASTGMVGLYLFCAISPEILIGQHHLSGTFYGMFFGLNALVSFTANILAARLIKYLNLKGIIRIGLGIMITASFSMLILNHEIHSVWHFMLPMFCLTLGIGLSMGCSTALALKPYETLSAPAASLISSAQFAVAGTFGYFDSMGELGVINIALPMLILSIISSVAMFRE